MSTPNQSALPSADSLSKLLSSLYDKRVVVTQVKELLPATAYRGICDYVDTTNKVHFICAIDLALYCTTGAALAMVPAAVVAEAIRAGKPSDSLRENAFEVFNIAASMLNEMDPTRIHVKLRNVATAPPVPPALAPFMLKPAQRTDFVVTVPGYPPGKVAVFAPV